MLAPPLGLLFISLAGRGSESCAFAFLDAQGSLLGLRHTPALDSASVAVPLRRVAADAVALDATSVVMAHNHPSGDPSPSAADRAVTRRLAHNLDALGIRLIEHVIVAGERYFSLRAAGML